MSSWKNTIATLGVMAFALTVASPALAQNGDGAISIEAAVARSIDERMPVDTGSVFPADVGQLWMWTRVKNAEGRKISPVWQHGGHEWVVDLPVGAQQWRAWSSKVIPELWQGEWTVEVRDESGVVLSSKKFRVGN